MNSISEFYLVAYLIMSFITLTIYVADKLKAINGSWRINEATLLIFPWLLGSLGAILGLYVVRHKTKHWYFVVNNILATIVHVVIFVMLLGL